MKQDTEGTETTEDAEEDLLCDLRDLCDLCVPAFESLPRATSHTILVRARLILVPSHCDMARRFLSPSIGTGTFAVPPTFPTFGSLLALNFRWFLHRWGF